MLGFGAAFPRSVWVHGYACRAWVLGDLCFRPESRSLGPALVLQRACLNTLSAGQEPIWFDFPSRAMMAIYKRLGIPATANQIRYVKLYRVDGKVEQYLPHSFLTRGVCGVMNVALKFQRKRSRFPNGVEVSIHEGRFDSEFTALDTVLADSETWRGIRTAEYLNWRYVQNPLNRYCVIVARRGSPLLGYAVLEVGSSSWILADLHAVDPDTTVPALLAYIDELAEASDVESVSAIITETASSANRLRRSGFFPREGHPFVANIGSRENKPDARSAEGWDLMHGDRDS
jgi:hypothetical protein